METKSMRGGRRAGAGRPYKYGEPTELFAARVPKFLKPLIEEFIQTTLKLRDSEEYYNWLNSWRIK